PPCHGERKYGPDLHRLARFPRSPFFEPQVRVRARAPGGRRDTSGGSAHDDDASYARVAPVAENFFGGTVSLDAGPPHLPVTRGGRSLGPRPAKQQLVVRSAATRPTSACLWF